VVEKQKKIKETGEKIITRDFALLFASSFLFMGSLYLLIPILSLYMKRVIGISTTQVGILMGILTLSAMVFRPLAGKWIDSLGRRPVLALGAIDFAIFTPLYIVARGILTLPFILAMHGAGIAFFHTASLAMIGDRAPVKHRGKAMSWFQISYNLAIMLAPVASQITIGTYDDRLSRYIPLFILSSALSLVALVLILKISKNYYSPDLQHKIRLSSLSEKRVLASACISGFFGTMALGACEAFLALFAKKYQIPNFALFFTTTSFVIISIRLLFGSIPDLLGRKQTIMISLVIIGISMIVLSGSRTFLQILIAAVVFGTGFTFLPPTISALLSDTFKRDSLGRAFGVYTFFYEGGIAFGAIIMGPLTSAYSFRFSYLAVGLITFFGSALFWLLFRQTEPKWKGRQ